MELAVADQQQRSVESVHEQVMLPPRPLAARKGRGAVSNVQGRFEVDARERVDDGWGDGGNGRRAGEHAGEHAGAEGGHERGDDNCNGNGNDNCNDSDAAAPLRTIVTEEFAKTILSRNASPDIPFNVSINPYRGCEHGCIYCFARPSHSYLGLSPGLDFETRLFAKVNGADLLRRELAHPAYVAQSIALGVNTDAYQPCERSLGLTRQLLEVLRECAHPVGLITKSSLIERDIDILAPMAQRRLAMAAITLTTLDPVIARTLEPRAASPARRLRTIRTLVDAGIACSVSVAPIIPFVTEPEIERILQAAAQAGASSAHYTVLRLPWEVNTLFQQWLQAHFPERAQRVMNRVREMRGGRDYDADFATRMHGEGVWADLIRQRFNRAAAQYGLSVNGRRHEQLDCSQFVRPRVVPAAARPAGKGGAQLDLF